MAQGKGYLRVSFPLIGVLWLVTYSQIVLSAREPLRPTLIYAIISLRLIQRWPRLLICLESMEVSA